MFNSAGSRIIRGAAALTAVRTAVWDANYTAAVNDRIIAYTAITAARTVALPAAASFPTGTVLLTLDESGSANGTETITLSANGSDTIADGSSSGSSVAITTARGIVGLESDGVSGWTVVSGVIAFNGRLGAVAPAAGDYTQAQVTPAYAVTVFTSNGTFTTAANSTTSTVYRYRIQGGGGGGGGAGSGATFFGAGGGGGEYAEGTFTGVAASTGITVTVGGAGTAGSSSGTSGTGGGATTIGSPVSITANGGNGGNGATGSSAAFAGAGAGGGSGTASFRISGTSGQEGEGPFNSGSYLPAGGNSKLGIAAPGIAYGFGSSGSSGAGYGAGGGGGENGGAGGAGTGGIVIIERIQG